MAPVLWDSKSLPRSRGSFYSEKDDCYSTVSCNITHVVPVLNVAQGVCCNF